MLIIALLKGVPARTTQVITAGGVLRREEMDIVMNPYDAKTMQAADYVKRRAGGKIVALSMGPETKLVPIMNELYFLPPESNLIPKMTIDGIDENFLLSDRKMAGADTLATSYAVALGVKKVVDINIGAIEELINMVKDGANKDDVKKRALELYDLNLLPNAVFSTLKAVKNTIISDFVDNKISKDECISKLNHVKDSIGRFLVIAGMKTTDGETGSTGPQVAEALSDIYGFIVPHITYIHDFEIDPEEKRIYAERKIGSTIQVLECPLPAVITISHEYLPRVPPAGYKKHVRANSYKGKVRKVTVWNADAIGADAGRLGLIGSPTLVGPGVDIAKPPSQKYVDRSYIFVKDYGEVDWDGKKYGPFSKGDVADNLPEGLIRKLADERVVTLFTLDKLVEDLFSGLLISARTVYQEKVTPTKKGG